MILYFSGTGNSEYVAKRIGKATGDECLDLFDRIRGHDVSPIHAERPLVVVAPTYAWRLPRIVESWLEATPITGTKQIYFVLTCGETIGNAGQYLADLCRKKQMAYAGCVAIVMPENYIALFSTPTPEQAAQIIAQAEPVIDRAIHFIQQGRPFPQKPVSALDRVNSSAVNRLFYPLFVHARKFYVTDACISCGRCASVCPLNNIQMKDGKPIWGSSCTHCMACICRCPKEAIEYGRHSRGLPRYTCTKEV